MYIYIYIQTYVNVCLYNILIKVIHVLNMFANMFMDSNGRRRNAFRRFVAPFVRSAARPQI